MVYSTHDYKKFERAYAGEHLERLLSLHEQGKLIVNLATREFQGFEQIIPRSLSAP
jgi:hypothetical protein